MVTIRPATSEDYAAVEKIDAVVYVPHALERPDLFDPAMTNTISQTGYEGILKSPDATVLVADKDGAVVGFACVVLQDLSDRPWSPHKLRAEIDSIGILVEYQGQGIGTALLRASDQWALEHKATYIRLTVHDFNGRAQHLYEREGFKPERLIMAKELQAPHV